TMCCGLVPTLNRSTTLRATGSITYTLLDRRFGTYTRTSSLAVRGLRFPARASEYRLAALTTGGMPATTSTPGAAVWDCDRAAAPAHSAAPAVRIGTDLCIIFSMGAPRQVRADRSHGLGNDLLDAQFAQLRAGAPGVAPVHALRRPKRDSWLQQFR